MKWILYLQLIINLIDMNDNKPMFPLSQYIVQGIAETVPNGTHIIQGTFASMKQFCALLILNESVSISGKKIELLMVCSH